MPTISGNPYPRDRAASSEDRAEAAPLPLNVPVADEHAAAALRQQALQLLDECDRAMPPARAADGDREVALALVLVVREREVEQAQHVSEEVLRLIPLEDVVGDGLVGADAVAEVLGEERGREGA